ncbi:SRPBCC family protein [Granulicella arctica]|uniref:SRPBCC family protein n=1 Tax=Granulicella arctica TaxID=940613 RepID=UPI0021E045CF|nr:SRPBCC family protein [Granulicella arctica]
MITSILSREITPEPDTYPVPQSGSEYVALPNSKEDGVVTASAAQTIQGKPAELYELWSDVTLFPRWQEGVVSVSRTGPTTSHWIMGDPEDQDGKRVEFDSEITEDISGEKISWRSTGGDVHQSGTVTFVPTLANRGTLVTLTQAVKVPLGSLGNALAGIAKRSPKQIVIEDLRHFKQIVEAGEIPSVRGQSHGPRGVSGGVKEWMYGETNPTPPGTSEQE